MAYAIIFDLDGTLADTMDDLKTAVNSTLNILGYDNRTKFELLNFINNGARELVRRSLPTAVQSEDFIIDSALNIYNQEYAKCYCDKTRAYPGIYEALQVLKQEKFKLAVLSNKPHQFVSTIIYKLFGATTFDIVMGKSDFPHKPDPSAALYIAKELGVKPNKCIFVGDSDIDIRTAENADMRSIGVSWGYRSVELLTRTGANYIAENPSQIIEHAKECVRIIKLEKKLRKSERKRPHAEMHASTKEEPSQDKSNDILAQNEKKEKNS